MSDKNFLTALARGDVEAIQKKLAQYFLSVNPAKISDTDIPNTDIPNTPQFSSTDIAKLDNSTGLTSQNVSSVKLFFNNLINKFLKKR